MNRRLQRLLAIIFIGVLFTTSVGAQTAPQLLDEKRLQIRAYTEPSGEVYLGQQMRFFVEVLTDSWFTTSPRFRELRVEGAIALEPERFSSNVTRREGARTLNGIRRGFLIYPQRSGELTIPAVDVTFAVALEGQPSQLMTLPTKPVSLTVQVPPGAESREQYVTATKLTATQSLEPAVTDLKVGDALTRTVIVNAENTQALLLPAIEFAVAEGMAIYPAEPQLSNAANRGSYSGERVDSVTYLLEQPGDYVLPEIEIHWWNPVARKFATVVLAETAFSVADNPLALREQLTVDELSDAGADFGDKLRTMLDWLIANMRAIILSLGGLYLLLLLKQRYGQVLLLRWQEYRRRVKESPDRYFHQLEAACRNGDAGKIMSAFWVWVDATGVAQSKVVAALNSGALDPEFVRVWKALSKAFYKDGLGNPKVERRLLLRGVRALRKWITQSGQVRLSGKGYITSLNPRP